MSESVGRKSTTASAACAVVGLAIPVLVSAQSPCPQSSCPGIHVNILDIRNNEGVVACALFETSEGFPREFLRHAETIMIIKVRDTEARCNFQDIPEGRYALTVIHDEDMNGEMETNWLGIPKEGYGFSNDVTAGMSAPSFEDASFVYDGRTLDMTISLNY